MKKIRLIALLCAVVMLISMVGAASAASVAQPKASLSDRFGGNFYTLANGETKLFFISNYPSYMTDEQGTEYSDVIFDCAGAVTGKSSASWIKLKNYKQGFIISFSKNKTTKTRTGTITVTGKKYKATLKFTQLGTDKISSAIRNKKTVNIKLKLCSGVDSHRLTLYRYKLNDEGETVDGTYEQIEENPNFSATSYKFTVAKGYRYTFYLYPVLSGMHNNYYCYCYFDVTDVTGTDIPDYLTNWW